MHMTSSFVLAAHLRFVGISTVIITLFGAGAIGGSDFDETEP